ncbi:hypothetical protein ETTORE_0418 [Pseudomonas phage Ettore]|nr:hypothetical protein ETTORE_0418 [Pseudomonas phage Ettore]
MKFTVYRFTYVTYESFPYIGSLITHISYFHSLISNVRL